ncbi:hypothetical protein PT273_00400 [Orbaceae bacterium ESL0727]|nr:hypothetical protein [Orbaceae bacterium ESL0727]
MTTIDGDSLTRVNFTVGIVMAIAFLKTFTFILAGIDGGVDTILS